MTQKTVLIFLAAALSFTACEEPVAATFRSSEEVPVFSEEGYVDLCTEAEESEDCVSGVELGLDVEDDTCVERILEDFVDMDPMDLPETTDRLDECEMEPRRLPYFKCQDFRTPQKVVMDLFFPEEAGPDKKGCCLYNGHLLPKKCMDADL